MEQIKPIIAKIKSTIQTIITGLNKTKPFFQSIKKLYKDKRVRFSFVIIIYIIWFVLWTANLWWLLGVPFIYDYYFTKYTDKFLLTKYRAWKNRNKTNKVVMEWIEALLYAIIVVVPLKLYFFGLYVIPTPSMENTLLVGDYIFVDRLAYGPKMPITPLSFPFVQHTMPLTEETPSFSNWIQFSHKRLSGYSTPQNGDVIVFNFPTGDTVAVKDPTTSYYDLVRIYGRENVLAQTDVVYRPVDKRENYIKRCVGIAGDTLQVIDDKVWINGQQEKSLSSFIFKTKINNPPITIATFPHSPKEYAWTYNNYGPIWIPQSGVTVDVTLNNLPMYERVIRNYEGNTLYVRDSSIYINGSIANSYTFKMDYYFMMGDNRDNSLDSRFFGFVPEDHIEGKATMIWLSIRPDKSIFDGVRWERVFKSID